LRSGVPPISKAKQPVAAAASPTPPVDPLAEPPAPKPESVSLIDDTRSKRAESSGPEPKIKSVLPPISKIRPPILTKAPEPSVPPAPSSVPEVVPVPVASEPATPASDEKIVHIKPPIIVRELAQQ